MHTGCRRDERGLSESTQWAVLTPVIMFAFLGSLQAGLILHGRNVAHHAAAAAAEVASVSDATPGAAESAAIQVAKAGGLDEVTVRVRRSSAEVHIEVSGRRPVLVDFGSAYIVETATAPVESVS